MLIIHNVHRKGVTAIAGTRDCKRIVSGGGEGQVSAALNFPTNSMIVVQFNIDGRFMWKPYLLHDSSMMATGGSAHLIHLNLTLHVAECFS